MTDSPVDPQDPLLDPYRKPRGRPGTRESGLMLVESEIAVTRLLQGSTVPASVVCTPARAPRLRPLVRDRAPLLILEEAALSRIMGFDFHRGCAAVAPRPRPTITDLWPILDRPRARLILAERLSDPANVGALIRNAVAFGADAVVLDAAGADPYERRSIRASMGNVFRIPVFESSDLIALASEIRKHPETRVLAATTGDGATPVGEVEPGPRAAIVVGNEGHGISDALLATCDAQVTIPIHPEADSLNVAAATAVLLFALCPV